MRGIFVLAEHRRGELRDITLEMLSKGRELAKKIDAELVAVLLGHDTENFAKELSTQVGKVLVVNDIRLKDFNAEVYQRVLSSLIMKYKPLLTLIGHTSFGVDLAPALAVELVIPLATDCIDLGFEDRRLFVTRQMYGGKVNVHVSLHEAESYLVTVRQAAFKAEKGEPLGGEIIRVESPLSGNLETKRLIEYVEPPVGEVDITKAEVIVSVGRGIKDEKNLPLFKELAQALKGEIGCSRPIVDKGWLPKDRQVGFSGKTVKPKVYIAIGISGAFQHTFGMKNSELIVAINKDQKAPIFRVADYGIVGDMFKVIPALTDKINELKQSAS